MRLIADGVVDREGVAGLARRLGYTERHLHRQLVAVVGAGPLAVARAQRAQTARILLETTRLPIAEVAFAAGFRSVRQFNETVRQVFAMTPSELRASAGRDGRPEDSGALTLRLPYRAPLDADALLSVPRPPRDPRGGGAGRRRLSAQPAATTRQRDRRAATAGRERPRALLARRPARPGRGDPALARADGPRLRPAQRRRGARRRAAARAARALRPGLRVAGAVDGDELAVRAVLGQQVSLRGAATLASRLVAEHGEPLERPLGSVTHVFPSTRALAEADPGRPGHAPRARPRPARRSLPRSAAETSCSTRAPIARRRGRG